MKISRDTKAFILSSAIAIGLGSVGYATYANAASTVSPQTASASQKDTDTETNDDHSMSPDTQQDGETKD